MTTNYPAGLDSYVAKVDGVDDVMAAHVNNMQDAIVAIETELGTQPRHTDTVAPTVNDDSGDDYSVGTIWTDTTNDRIYVAIDVTAGAAIWKMIACPWTNWTPTLTQGAAVAATVTEAKYILNNQICHCYARLAATAAGTGGNAISIGGQPAEMQPAFTGNFALMGSGAYFDAGAAIYSFTLSANSAAAWWMYGYNVGSVFGLAPAITIANTDVIAFHATYRVA